jgi:hypothetical protein
MKTKTLKILTALSFITILIPGNMFSLPMGFAILGIFSNTGDTDSFYLIPSLIALIYLFVSSISNKNTIKDIAISQLCLIILLITSVYGLKEIINNFNYPSIISIAIYFVFHFWLTVKLIISYRTLRG